MQVFSLFAAPETQQAPQGGGQMMIIMMLMFVIFYFILIRPQRKRQKELEERIAALKNGDTVVTTGGLHGRVAGVKKDTVLLAVAPNVKLEFDKTSVANTVSKGGEKNDTSDAKGASASESKKGAPGKGN